MTLEELIQNTREVADNAESWLDNTKGANEPIQPAKLAKHYWYLKENYDRLKKELTRIYHVVDAVDKHLLPEAFDAAGTDLIRIPELGRSFSVKTMMSASMKDKEAGAQWLRDQGHGDLVQETVNAGTLASFMRSYILDEGMEPPEDIFKVTTYNKTNTTKYNPK